MFFLFAPLATSRADEADELGKQIQGLKTTLDSITKANATNEKNLIDLNSKLQGIKNRIAAVEIDIAVKEKEVQEGETVMTYQRTLLNERVRSYYKNVNKSSLSLLTLLVEEDFSASLQNFFYQKSLTEEDKKAVLTISKYIKDLEAKKTSLTNEKRQLDVIKQDVAKQSEFLAGEVAKARSAQGELQQKIAELSAKQQQILNSRSGSFTVNIGDSELADDYNASIKGFRESAPGGYFAVFSFGGHTHRKGMSQYGARGRAESGKNYHEILQAYYGKDTVSKDTGGDINVSGYGSMNFEDRYLLGIAEMPSSWHPEALKAQAVAARTYAYRYKVDGREICTNEACQVFSSSKADDPPQAWKDAVSATRGQILEDVVTYYASTHGGYITTSGWDTTDGGGGGNFIDKAYEKIGGSPWLYKAWYTEGYSVNSDKCGRSDPWLSPEDMADIVNAALVLSKGTTDEASRITPVTTSCWGGNPYSHEELRNIASKYGGISSATSVSVSQGEGTTNSVTVNGVSMSGAEFKKGFNLRAPGFLKIPQYQFAFFNIEKK